MPVKLSSAAEDDRRARSYSNDIAHFDALLDKCDFQSARSLFTGSFLRKAAVESQKWQQTMPTWFAFYAEHFTSEETRLHRIRELELVLSKLRNSPGAGPSRRSLEARIKDPGFQGSEAFFEVSILSAALTLPPQFSIRLYPRVGSSLAEFSMAPEGRPIFFEATCFKLQGKRRFESLGDTLTFVGISDRRVKSKIEDKRSQLSRDYPNVLLIGSQGFDPSEGPDYVAQVIFEEIQKHSQSSCISAVAVFFFNPLGKLMLIDAKSFECGHRNFTSEEARAIKQFENCFSQRPVGQGFR